MLGLYNPWKIGNLSHRIGQCALLYFLVILSAGTILLPAYGDQYCTGNACLDFQVTYEGAAPNGCHVVKNVGRRAFHFTWGAFSGDLRPNQASQMRNLFGGCVQYIVGQRTAVYITPSAPPSQHSAAPPFHPGAPDPTFKYLGDLYGYADQGKPAFNAPVSVPINLDAGKEIDTSYQQTEIKVGNAPSSLKASQIPRGIFILNTEGSVYWAFFDPKLSGNAFSMQLYCGPQPPPGAGCNVRVSVWVKERPVSVK